LPVAVKKLPVGEVLLLENLRFYREEELNDADFARQLVKLSMAELFVQDGFGVAHRRHASTDAITNYLPSVAGLLLEREWAELKTALRDPNRPLVSVIGGAKIVDKMPLLRQLLRRSDSMIIGGALANNFFVSLGLPVGASVWQPEADAETSEIITAARSRYGGKLKQHFLLPVDVAVSRNGNPKMARHNVARTQVAANNCIYDIGPKTINRVTEVIAKAGTVIWNGTMGLSSYENFSHGSARIAMTLAENPQIKSIILGGDTVDFVRRWDVLDGGSFGYLSTGGGAALALLAGKRLPGLDALLDR
jgi:phosphoglycerate kinase